MPSVFDQAPGVVKGDGQVHPTGVGSYAAPVAPPAPAAAPGAPGQDNPIAKLVQMLIEEMAPKSVKDIKPRTDQAIDAASGDQPLVQALGQ